MAGGFVLAAALALPAPQRAVAHERTLAVKGALPMPSLNSIVAALIVVVVIYFGVSISAAAHPLAVVAASTLQA